MSWGLDMLTRSSDPDGAAPVILVVDDHEDTLDLISDFLRWKGAEPLSATSVPHAYRLLEGRLREGRPVDAVVTDYAMPGGDGVSFLRQLRARAEHAHLPVVMVSGQASDDIVREAEALGARYLAKPLDLETLAATLRTAMAEQAGTTA